MKVLTDIAEVTCESSTAVESAVYRALLEYNSVIRWGVIKKQYNRILLEVSYIEGQVQPDSRKQLVTFHNSSRNGADKRIAAMIVPTGVGASIGGFIGDASPASRVLEHVVDQLIVHPNVVNAGSFYGGGDKSLYIDGFALDSFFSGFSKIGCERPRKIGVLFDRLPPNSIRPFLNSLDGIRAVAGVEVTGYCICSEKIRGRVSLTEHDHFIGTLDNLDVLLEGAERLIQYGADAIAVVTDIDGYTEKDVIHHYAGHGVNPVGVFEALVSRAISFHTDLPCAHAPVYSSGLGNSNHIVHPRAAAEVSSKTGLNCLMHGLSKSRLSDSHVGLTINDLMAIIVPGNCVGGLPALAASRAGIPVITVSDNVCVVGVTAEEIQLPGVIRVKSYADAVALLCCLSVNIGWECFNGNFAELREIPLKGNRAE